MLWVKPSLHRPGRLAESPQKRLTHALTISEPGLPGHDVDRQMTGWQFARYFAGNIGAQVILHHGPFAPGKPLPVGPALAGRTYSRLKPLLGDLVPTHLFVQQTPTP